MRTTIFPALRTLAVAGLALSLLAACNAGTPAEPASETASAPTNPAPQTGPEQAPEADTTHSASLAGAVRWADAEPADLDAETTYTLPGLIHADISLDNLRLAFGEDNVQLADLDGAEGEVIQGAVLFPGDPARRAELFFRNQERHSGIDAVRVRAGQSCWHLASGVRPGMTLADIVQANGAPVSFSGLDWDYGGTVTDWHGGKANPAGAAAAVTVRLGHAENASGYPVGDGTFRSDDERYPGQGTALRVDEIGVTFDG